jgi:hypothetical protein
VGEDAATVDYKQFYIEGAIIVDKHTKSERYFARHNHVNQFVDEFKTQGKQILGKELLFGEWPPVFTGMVMFLLLKTPPLFKWKSL